MSNKKNIDRLFQEKFKDFEVAPNDAVWNRISESLPNKKKKRRIIALWWQIGGVAAVIALLLTVGISVFNSEDNNNNLPVVNTEDKDSTIKDDNTPSTKKQNELNKANTDKFEFVDSDTNKESIIDEQKEGTKHSNKVDNVSTQLTTPNKSSINKVANSTSNTKTEQKTTPTQKHNNLKQIPKSKNAVAVNKVDKTLPKSKTTNTMTKEQLKSVVDEAMQNEKTAVVANTKKSESSETKTIENNIENKESEVLTDPKIEEHKESILDALASNDENSEKEKEDKQTRWSIAPNVAPVYFSSLGQGSSLDKQFNTNTKSSDVNMSYGITGSYAISKKLKVRAGVNRVNLSQTTSDVFAFTGAETAARGIDAQFGHITFKGGAQTVSLMSSKMLDRASAPEVFNTKIAGNLDQRFGFIEVPLELEYRVLDKKFGINVIGGFSTFFLNENEIYADVNGASTLLGEANNINNTSFSANLGLGLDYSLSKQWNINLEPQFKYQINTFNETTGNFRPFFIGVYTGLSFKF